MYVCTLTQPRFTLLTPIYPKQTKFYYVNSIYPMLTR